MRAPITGAVGLGLAIGALGLTAACGSGLGPQKGNGPTTTTTHYYGISTVPQTQAYLTWNRSGDTAKGTLHVEYASLLPYHGTYDVSLSFGSGPNFTMKISGGTYHATATGHLDTVDGVEGVLVDFPQSAGGTNAVQFKSATHGGYSS
ncbi:MAG TPA: hypothetical protein VGS21_00965 [Acidimicrobiales bacterium]|nr:hypothetical protein [Acidimicrobiales bacterium]